MADADHPEAATAAYEPPSRIRRIAKAIGLTGVALILVGIMVGGIGILHLRADASAAAEAEQTVLPVQTVTVRYENGYAVRERFSGRLEAARETAVAFEKPGLVTAVLVDEGDRVEANQVIARQDAEPLKAQRAGLAAELKATEARVALWKATENRRKTLSQKGFSSSQAYDDARFEAQAIRANADGIRAQIRALDIDIEKTVIRAPFGGIVGGRMVDDGAVVAAGTQVLSILEDRQPIARVGVSLDVASALKPGQTYRLNTARGPVDGVLRAIRRDLARQTRTVPVLFEVMAADVPPLGEVVDLISDRPVAARGFWVPLTALAEGHKGLWTVFAVVQKDGRSVVAREAVEVVHFETDRAFVRGTPANGARLMAAGLHRVVPGQTVSVLAGDAN